MSEIFLYEGQTTGNNDGSSWADAYQSFTDLANASITLTENSTLYVNSDGTTNSAKVLSIDISTYTLDVYFVTGSLLYYSASYGIVFSTTIGSTGVMNLHNINISLDMSDMTAMSLYASSGGIINVVNPRIIGYETTSGSGIYLQNADGTYNIDGGVIVGSAYGINGGDCPGVLTITDAYIYAGTACIVDTTGTTTITTTATSDTTGSSGLQSIAYDTTQFTNVTSGSEDFTLVSGSSLINAGTTTSFTTDFNGDTWDSPRSVGIYAYSSVTTWTITYDGNGSDGGSVPVDGSSPYDDGSTVT